MKKKILVCVALLVVTTIMFSSCSLLSSFLQAQTTTPSSNVKIDVSNLQTATVAETVAKNTINSCVRIEVSFYGSSQEARGAGFIITTDGYIVTNRHVCVMYDNGKDYRENPLDTLVQIKSIKAVFANNTYYEAELVGFSTDRTKDIAILKMKNFGTKEFEPIKFDLINPVDYGHYVYTFGNPEGLGLMFAEAMVASPNHEIQISDGVVYEDIIVLDGNVNHGNSGGVLLNVLGNAVGLVYGRIESTNSTNNNVYGIGCALSIKDVKDFILSKPELKTNCKFVEYVKPVEETSEETPAAE